MISKKQHKQLSNCLVSEANGFKVVMYEYCGQCYLDVLGTVLADLTLLFINVCRLICAESPWGHGIIILQRRGHTQSERRESE